MKKRVAILIPGLVRSFEKTYQNLFENIIQHNQEDYEFDIFLDIWDSSNSNISEFYRRGVNSERDYRDAISNENIDCSLLKKNISLESSLIKFHYDRKNGKNKRYGQYKK